MRDLGPFVHEGNPIAAHLVLKFFETHSKVNECIALLWLLGLLLLSQTDFDCLVAAKMTLQLKETLLASQSLVTSCPPEFETLPLNCSMYFYDQWISTVLGICGFFQDFVIERARGQMDVRRKAVEEASPNWGQSVTEKSLNLSTAKIQLVDNAGVKRLPSLAPQLWNSMQEVNAVCLAMKLPDFATYEGTRERASLASHALEFAKRTVSMAAAVTVALSEDPVALRKILQHRSVLPASLVSYIEGILNREEGPTKRADGSGSSSQASAKAGAKRGAPSATAARSAGPSSSSSKVATKKRRMGKKAPTTT